jgi:hypothetical protein
MAFCQDIAFLIVVEYWVKDSTACWGIIVGSSGKKRRYVMWFSFGHDFFKLLF